MSLTIILFCNSDAGKKLFSLLGQLFSFIMIIVPIILILMGTIDFVKATISQKDDEMKKAQNRFIKRLIYAVIIFFISPTVGFIMSLLGEKIDSPCMYCFNYPNDTICKVTIKNIKDNINVIPIEITDNDCKNSADKNLCCKQQNNPNDADGIWIWDDNFGCKNTTAAIP